MEAKECQDKSADVKWPIASDGYIPNSMIRGRLRMLKRAKWKSAQDSDEEFYIGHYEDYKGLRAWRPAKKNEKRSYVEWDYRPELDERVVHEDNSDSQTEEGKEESSSKDDKKQDKGRKDGRERFGFDFALERKHPEDTVNEPNKEKMVNTKHSSVESKKETKTAEVLKEKDLTQQHKAQDDKALTTECVEKMPHISLESQDPGSQAQKKPADQNKKLPNQQLTSDININKKTLLGDPLNKNVQPKIINGMPQTTIVKVDHKQQTTSQVKTAKPQKTKTEFGPAQSTQHSSEKNESLMSKSTFILESRPGVPQSELREAKDPIDTKSKPLSKLQKLSEADKTPAPTVKAESTGPLPGHQTKPPKSDKKLHSVISEPKSQVATSTRDLNLVPEVLSLYKKFKSGKWVSSKAQGRWSSSNLRLSSFKSKWSNTEAELERLGPAESVYQQGSGEEIDGGSTQSIGQSGLWNLIMEGVSASMDQDSLGRLLRDRLTDGLDIGGLTGIIDQSDPGGLGSAIPTKDDTGLAGLRAVSAESMDKANLWGLIRDRPTESVQTTHGLHMGGATQLRAGTNGLREAASESIDQAALCGQIKDRPTEVLDHAGPGRLGPRTARGKITTESMVQTGSGGLDHSLGPYGALGLRETVPQATVQTGPGETDFTDRSHGFISQRLQSRTGTGQTVLGRSIESDYTGSEALREFMTYHHSGRLGVHRPSESQTSLIETSLGRPESMIPSGTSTEIPCKFMTQTNSRRVSTYRPQESKESMVQTALGHTAPQSMTQTGPGGGGLGGPSESKNQTGPSGQSVQTSTQSTVRTRPGHMGTSRSQDQVGLETVQSMVHTPGLLTSSDPEQFLKALSQHQHSDRPMSKSRQRLYQLIFLYGFCSPQTAKLLAKEKCVKLSQTKKQHKDHVELYQCWDPITPGSAVHERVVRRVQFQDIVDQASSDFHCVIPLPSLNNFITLDKYGETEYGRLLFEWERGDEEDDQMKVVSKSVTL